MSSSTSFFYSGWEHIVDINAYDHLLFVMTLCAAFKLSQWRQILIIITAFTIGHSGTLILSALNIIPSNSKIIDMLIPLTIMVTAIDNVVQRDAGSKLTETRFKYLIALIFGLIHGLAFASNFKVMMFDESILTPLFLFNIGIEAGQIFIVFLFMCTLWVYRNLFKGEHEKWNIFVSGGGFGIAATLLLGAIAG